MNGAYLFHRLRLSDDYWSRSEPFFRYNTLNRFTLSPFALIRKRETFARALNVIFELQALRSFKLRLIARQ